MGNHHAEEDIERYESERRKETCKNCEGLVVIRNPRGDCDHLSWPDNLTDEAMVANGYRQVTETRVRLVK